jgi:hypothetical protein
LRPPPRDGPTASTAADRIVLPSPAEKREAVDDRDFLWAAALRAHDVARSDASAFGGFVPRAVLVSCLPSPLFAPPSLRPFGPRSPPTSGGRRGVGSLASARVGYSRMCRGKSDPRSFVPRELGARPGGHARPKPRLRPNERARRQAGEAMGSEWSPRGGKKPRCAQDDDGRRVPGERVDGRRLGRRNSMFRPSSRAHLIQCHGSPCFFKAPASA